jgi:phosphate starvation-inducible PhoH-like protein
MVKRRTYKQNFEHGLTKVDEIKQNDVSKFNFKLSTKNKSQKLALRVFDKIDYLFLIGPAGVGKSYSAVSLAINRLLQLDNNKLILTRPIIESGECLGFLPGNFDEKVAPYIMPIYDQLEEIFPNEMERKTFVSSYIKIEPLAYMRGRTFNNSVCILDEAQNATYKQLKMYLTRMGYGSKMIITGDPDQIDIEKTGKNKSGLLDIIDRCSHRSSVSVIHFSNEENVRHPSVEWMLEDL